MLSRFPAAARAVFVAALLIAAVTAGAVRVQANAITAGFAYLVAVLGVAIWQGVAAGIIASLLATFCFNFFFLPPVGTFHIADAF